MAGPAQYAYTNDGIFLRWLNPITFSSNWDDYAYYTDAGLSTETIHVLGITFLTNVSLPPLSISNILNPLFWCHIEDRNARLQGVLGLRTESMGDDVYQITRNGNNYTDKIKQGVGITQDSNLVGVAYLPMKNKL